MRIAIAFTLLAAVHCGGPHSTPSNQGDARASPGPTATDPAFVGMAEITVTLKPEAQWRPGMTWDRLLDEMDAKLRIPGFPNIWWMPIQTRTEMGMEWD